MPSYEAVSLIPLPSLTFYLRYSLIRRSLSCANSIGQEALCISSQSARQGTTLSGWIEPTHIRESLNLPNRYRLPTEVDRLDPSRPLSPWRADLRRLVRHDDRA